MIKIALNILLIIIIRLIVIINNLINYLISLINFISELEIEKNKNKILLLELEQHKNKITDLKDILLKKIIKSMIVSHYATKSI